MPLNPPSRYEDYADIIESLLSKSKSKWTLTADSACSFEDVAQIIRSHIAKKLEAGLYDPSRKFEPWCFFLISNQIKNLIKSNYSSLLPPCRSLKCAAFSGENSCAIYGSPCDKCPLFRKYNTSRRFAADIKMPVTIESHIQQVHDMPNVNLDIEKGLKELSSLLEKRLTVNEFYIYKAIYLEGLDEATVSKKLGYKTTEEGRPAGYWTINEYKTKILAVAKEIIYNDLDL